MTYLLFIIQVSMLLTLILLPLLLLYRLIISIINKRSIKEIILITLIPLSIGYYKYLKDEEKTKAYNILLIIISVLALIGISFTLFQILIPDYNDFI